MGPSIPKQAGPFERCVVIELNRSTSAPAQQAMSCSPNLCPENDWGGSHRFADSKIQALPQIRPSFHFRTSPRGHELLFSSCKCSADLPQGITGMVQVKPWSWHSNPGTSPRPEPQNTTGMVQVEESWHSNPGTGPRPKPQDTTTVGFAAAGCSSRCSRG